MSPRLPFISTFLQACWLARQADRRVGRQADRQEMAGELVKQVVEACRWEAGQEVGEGVARLMGFSRTWGAT